MKRYLCWEADAGIEWAEAIDAESAEDAAEQYVRAVDYRGDDDNEDKLGRTVFVPVRVSERGSDLDEAEVITVQLDPPEPPCWDEVGHAWEEGTAYGNGGGVIIREKCTGCGWVQVTNTWAQNPANGEQGFRTVTYHRTGE